MKGISMNNVKNGQRTVFLSHTYGQRALAWVNGQYVYPPAFPNPPIVVERKPGSIFTRNLTRVVAA